jgi:hypothetical protein
MQLRLVSETIMPFDKHITSLPIALSARQVSAQVLPFSDILSSSKSFSKGHPRMLQQRRISPHSTFTQSNVISKPFQRVIHGRK